jgi:pimeloyl-ACP methyl ester carboxylesterase
MHPLFFGDSKKALFGLYHQALGQKVRDVGIVLCYPGPQEYMTAHWAFRRLADRLSKSGFHVLRFDYFGTGDSAGEGLEGNISQWKVDVGTAARELVDMSGAKSISLVGARLGAALAAQAVIEGIYLRDVVLWDPVINGRAYLEELKALQRHLFPSKAEEFEKNGELLGYPISPSVVTGIEEVDLLAHPPIEREKVSLVVSEERKEYLHFAESFRSRGRMIDYRHVPDSTEWGKAEDLIQASLLNNVIREIESILVGS